ncbi:unnamed protein product [Schistosoma margrebowiei]|uniref:Uncharacterized protein n=1 Tax=Schistosoma margrebowiei TaxID=48269 RepID=A0A183LHT2_9TREM|nr:unnamed protein product [Schistosoma margrebowiei]
MPLLTTIATTNLGTSNDRTMWEVGRDFQIAAENKIPQKCPPTTPTTSDTSFMFDRLISVHVFVNRISVKVTARHCKKKYNGIASSKILNPCSDPGLVIGHQVCPKNVSILGKRSN